MASALIHRYLLPRIVDAMQDTPVVLVNGPRQAGKTTLVRQFADAARVYVTLDDAATLAAARHDPTGFVRDFDAAVIDEVQRAPELLLSIKQSVDMDRRPGRFLLTGSANVTRVQIRSATLINRLGGRDALASEPLDRQVKVAQNDLHTPHPKRTVPDCDPCQSRI